MTFYEKEAVQRLELPGNLTIEMVVLKRGSPIDQNISGLPALAAVQIAGLLFETGNFDHVMVFGRNGDKVIDYWRE